MAPEAMNAIDTCKEHITSHKASYCVVVQVAAKQNLLKNCSFIYTNQIQMQK